jgi:leader peptidase (prepilin peptidase)/N-methyltransferase
MSASPWILAPIGLVMALAVNYLADVLPRTRRLSRPACPHCGTPFPTGDYLLLRRCRSCGTRRTPRSFIVQLLGIPAALWTAYVSTADPKLPLALSLLLLGYLSVVLVIDVEHRAVLHETSYFGAILGLICGTYLWGPRVGEPLWQGLLMSLLGGLLGFGIMVLFYWLGERFVRWNARRRPPPAQAAVPGGEAPVSVGDPDEVALGFGDVNLTGILGLVLGPRYILPALFLAILAAGLFSLIVLVVALARKNYQPSMSIPYAPFLILGAAWLLYRP